VRAALFDAEKVPKPTSVILPSLTSSVVTVQRNAATAD
jgi:hypothetical protein